MTILACRWVKGKVGFVGEMKMGGYNIAKTGKDVEKILEEIRYSLWH